VGVSPAVRHSPVYRMKLPRPVHVQHVEQLAGRGRADTVTTRRRLVSPPWRQPGPRLITPYTAVSFRDHEEARIDGARPRSDVVFGGRPAILTAPTNRSALEPGRSSSTTSPRHRPRPRCSSTLSDLARHPQVAEVAVLRQRTSCGPWTADEGENSCAGASHPKPRRLAPPTLLNPLHGSGRSSPRSILCLVLANILVRAPARYHSLRGHHGPRDRRRWSESAITGRRPSPPRAGEAVRSVLLPSTVAGPS